MLDVAGELGMTLVGNFDLVLDDSSGVKHQIGKAFLPAFNDGMKISDLVNFLNAGLLHTKAFSNKEVLVDAIEPGRIF